jgi:ankyrin repeat protein
MVGDAGFGFAPFAAWDGALAQLDAAVPYLNRVFKDQGPLDDHAALFKKVFGRSKLRFVSIALLEVAYTDDPEVYYKQFLAALTALEKEQPAAAARTALLALAPLRLKRRFPAAHCLLDDAKITRDDEWNMARLFGTEWEKPVPWEPQDEGSGDWLESTSLHKAVEQCNLADVKRLLKAGADPNAKDGLGSTALEYAVSRGPALVKTLLDAGADPRGTDALGTALSYAPESERPAVVRMLLDHGADPNHTKKGRCAVLCYASGETLRMLLDAGADVNARGDHTPLVSAVIGNRPEEVELLLGRGADVNLRGKNRLSPMYFAKNLTKNEKIIALLQQHGANE